MMRCSPSSSMLLASSRMGCSDALSVVPGRGPVLVSRRRSSVANYAPGEPIQPATYRDAVDTRPVEGSVPSRRSLDRPGHGPEARALLAFSWETTPIGPVDSWPDQLRLLVQVMLSSEFPMMIVWGREYTQLYNDAFRPILGTGKHPGAMGRSARETWAEIWDEIGPLFASVFAGDAVWNADHRLLINRNGYDEETFFTYSYSPIHDDSDVVAGLLVDCHGDDGPGRRPPTTQLHRRSRQRARRGHVDRVGHRCDHRRLAGLPARHRGRDRRRRRGQRRANRESPRSPRRGDRSRPHSRRGELPPPGRARRGVGTGSPGITGGVRIDHPALRTVVTVATNPSRPYDEGYEQFIDLLRATMSASMTAAMVRADELGALRLISDTLQHAMLELASDLPTVAARYLPKASNLTVGGDWYDVLDLGGGRRGLIVGDCVGHGLEAATAMGALRNVSRALLADGRGPAEVIALWTGSRRRCPPPSCATVVCAVVDLADQTITYSNAGHPPPLLLHDDQVIWLDQALGTPLAVDEPARDETRVEVRPDDLLVLYTDGLVERRDEHLDDGLLRLANAALAFRDEPVEDVANRLIEELVGTTARDDVALVVKRIH